MPGPVLSSENALGRRFQSIQNIWENGPTDKNIRWNRLLAGVTRLFANIWL